MKNQEQFEKDLNKNEATEKQELSQEDLDAVSGGAYYTTTTFGQTTPSLTNIITDFPLINTTLGADQNNATSTKPSDGNEND